MEPSAPASAEAAASSVLHEESNFEEVTACMLCSSQEAELRFAEPPFRIVSCKSCGLVYVTPRLKPEVLSHVYDSDYWLSHSPSSRGYADYLSDASLYLQTFRRRLDTVAQLLPSGGRALDVGCAAGFFMRVLLERGWEVDGLEPSAPIAEIARQHPGLEDIHIGTLEDAPFAAGSYDLVTLWDVIEHVPDPVDLLRRAGAMLGDGGRLVLETQNVKSRFSRLLGSRWHHYKHLEHLYHFNPETLKNLLQKAGLEIEMMTPKSGGKYVSFSFIRERATRIHPFVGTLMKPLAALDRRSLYVNFGDELIVVAKKSAASA